WAMGASVANGPVAKATIINVYVCPSRRGPIVGGGQFHCDYAGNGGSNTVPGSNTATNPNGSGAGGQSDPKPTGVLVMNVAADNYVLAYNTANPTPTNAFQKANPPLPILAPMQNVVRMTDVTDATSTT